MLLASMAEKETSLKKAGTVPPPPEFKEESLDPVTKEIVKLFKQGKTIVEIAEHLHTTQGEVPSPKFRKKIKERTSVRKYIRKFFCKYSIKMCRGELIVLYYSIV